MADLIDREKTKAAFEPWLNVKGYSEGELNIIRAVLYEITIMPSAQPEIIRCKDCKYWHREIHNGIEYFNFSSCDLYHYGDGHNFYCADAERRTDE